MNGGWRAFGGTMGAALAGGAGAAAVMLALAGPGQRPGGEAVRGYLLDHPEVIPEAMQRLRDRQDGQVVAANRDQIVTAFPGAEAGNARGDVTVTEYYDYACGYCRQSVADLDRLAASDRQVHVVFKQMPVLSPLSDEAARLALAAARAGRFSAYHHALFDAGTLDEATMAAAARSAGIDAVAADTPAIAREIEATRATVRALGLTGTPAFVVGNRILSGAVGYDAIREAVTSARSGAAPA
ncbi:DsbA family protein [Sphingomonas sp.]|uniref:DsbA family protein n=1 Tax=Sphingomonas sp. TaxID=28214 RepID=UPI003B00E62A